MYDVTLLFCELYFTDPSARRFNVTFNGQQTLLSNFSIYEAAGMSEARMPSVSALSIALLAVSDAQTCS
jgi:hypothetical protein